MQFEDQCRQHISLYERYLQHAMGSILGGTSLTILGFGFFNMSHLDCLFGDIDAVTVIFVSGNEIRCNTPKPLKPTTVLVVKRFQELDYVTNRDVTGRFISSEKMECRTPAQKAGRLSVYLRFCSG